MRITFTFILFCSICCGFGQKKENPYPPLSPRGSISQTVGNTQIVIEYERPAARNRPVFGELVPWNTLWRTGAGHCTKIRFDKDVLVESQKIKAGTYSLFSIPNPDQWTFILNADTTLYGVSRYDREKDIARFKVEPLPSSRYYESLNFDIEILPNNARIYISWANTQVPFDVQTSSDREVEAFIEQALLSGSETDAERYAGAAEYLLYQGIRLQDAIGLAETAISLDVHNEWARDLKIRLLEKTKSYKLALAEIERYKAYVRTHNYDSSEDKENTLNYLSSEYRRISMLKE